MKISKKRKEAMAAYDADKSYTLLEAAEIIKKVSSTKFDSSFDMDVRLGVDPRQANQMVRGVASLPHGLGKTVRVLALVTPDKEEEAKAAGHPVITGKFPLGANGRALTQEAEKTAGFIRVCAREDDHRILGIQGVGTHISELVGEWTLALEMGALLEDIAGTIHAHPTMTERTHEGVLATLGHAIHSA